MNGVSVTYSILLAHLFLLSVTPGRLEKIPENQRYVISPAQLTIPSEESNLGKSLAFIANVNPTLSPFTRANCFIHVTSFVQAPFDFFEVPNFPLILRQISPQGVVSYTTSRRNMTRLVWMASQLRIPEKLNRSLIGCFNSPYMDFGTHSFKRIALCAKLNFSTFPLNTKPWSCEAYISVFPPSYALNNRNNSENHFKFPGAVLLRQG